MRQYQSNLDAEVFELLVERYWQRGFAAATRILRDRHAAEDALQDAFVRLLRRADRYDCAQPFAVWFYVILRNTCLDLQRRQKAARRLVDRAPQPTEAASEDDETGGLLDKLPKPDRDVLVLRIVQNMPFSEIAPALGCSEEAARKRAQRALRRLRKILAPQMHSI